MSTIFTIFWASGDLARLKIYPALFTLAVRKKLPTDFSIVGFARSQLTDSAFFEIFANSVRTHVKDWWEREEKILLTLESHISYITAQYDDAEWYQDYKHLIERISSQNPQPPIHQPPSPPVQVLYLAVPPWVVAPILTQFTETFEKWSRDIRVILEKPFGHDEASARALLRDLQDHYSDEELYFLDHYMGKKSMRSLLALRSKNRIIDTMINPSEIDRIEISALEDFTIRDRVGYFDSVGITRDMIQSHLFEMLALLTLDLPSSLDPASIARARQHLLDSLIFDHEKDHVSIGQYASYRSDHKITRDSETETFIALSLHIDQSKWRDVPIYLRSGKSLEKKETYIVITFLPAPHAGKDEEPNRIIISLYPEEEISMRFLDESGDRRETHEIITRESIAGDRDTYLGSHELLFLDAIEHERRFFLAPEEILASWRCVDRIFACIRSRNITPEIYPNNSRGPSWQYDVLKEWY